MPPEPFSSQQSCWQESGRSNTTVNSVHFDVNGVNLDVDSDS